MSLTVPRLQAGRCLVVIQVMISLVLLCGASLFVRTLLNLTSLDPGFLFARVEMTPPQHDPSRAAIAGIWEGLARRVSDLSSVRSAAVATLSPLSGRDRGVRI